jgi:hypothetical protein
MSLVTKASSSTHGAQGSGRATFTEPRSVEHRRHRRRRCDMLNLYNLT